MTHQLNLYVEASASLRFKPGSAFHGLAAGSIPCSS